MSGYVCFLITLLCDGGLVRCALKIDRDSLTGDEIQFPMEPENRAALHGLLPEHVKSCGPIVDVETIFEIAWIVRAKA